MKKTTLLLITLAFFATSCNQATRRQAQTTNNETVAEQKENIANEKTETAFHEITYAEIISQNDEIKNLCTSDLRIFNLWREDRGTSLVSLSEIDRLSEHPDSLAIPDLNGWEWEDMRFFELNAEYRRRFLERTGVSEADSVFVYDFVHNALIAFGVGELSVFAQLEFWSDWQPRCYSPPCPQYRYHIGFAIDNDVLPTTSSRFLIYVGKAHPFVRGRIETVTWERISSDDFPVDRAQLDALEDWQVPYYVRGDAYVLEWKHFRFYAQDWIDDRWGRGRVESWEFYTEDWVGYGERFVTYLAIGNRHLLVFNTKNDKLIAEGVSFYSGEVQYLRSLHNSREWIGYWFQNRPPAIFYSDTWGTSFMFLDPAMDNLRVLCDSRI